MMPYEGEYASYKPLKRITENEKVKQLLSRSKIYYKKSGSVGLKAYDAPQTGDKLPSFILAIDGSQTEVEVKTGYPGARIGYCTIASVLIDLALVKKLDSSRPINPKKFRETETAAAIDAALPGSNVVTRRRDSSKESFREELFDHFNAIKLEDNEIISLIDTYETLLAFKPKTHSQRCPYNEEYGCEHEFSSIPFGQTNCPSCHRPIYSTDALRIHERFNYLGTNGEAFGYVMQIWERLLMIHFLRCFEQKKLLNRIDNLAFFLDGPLAVFGPPAWISAAISKELNRINSIVIKET